MNDYMQDKMGIGESLPEQLGPRIINGLKKHSEYRGFFVQIDNDFAALANCNMKYSLPEEQPLINIHDFIVAPFYRQKGIGLFLLQFIEDFAAQKGFGRINLKVRQDNHIAQSLYRKAGFKMSDQQNYFWENPNAQLIQSERHV